MPNIELRNVAKKFEDGFTAVDNISLTIKDGEYVTLLGPSGCGKTTLLRMIAGLQHPSSGDILVEGRSVVSVPPEDRNIGFLFQNYSLFPHMNVGENVGYGSMIKGDTKTKTKRLSENMLRLVKMLEWAHYLPNSLSGGMQQRVALARSLASGCRILLLDEPLSSLDPKIGLELRYEIKRTATDIGLTVIHVTHDQADAMSISDKVVVMRKGKVIQVGTPKQIYNSPVSPYVAHFIGESNFLKVACEADKTVSLDGHKLSVPEFNGKSGIVLAIRPEKILFEKRLENTFEGVVERRNFLGFTTKFFVNVGSARLVVATAKYPELKKGDRVHLYLPPSAIKAFSGVKNLDEELKII